MERTVALRATLCRELRLRTCVEHCGAECSGACRPLAFKTCPVCARDTNRKPFAETSDRENPLCRRNRCKKLWELLARMERKRQDAARAALVAAVERGEPA